ncbi:MAG TPA: hypothetical protein VIN08_00715 [Ohtaekwangia sp.]|uniref:glycine-rich domain-containing protein n=1 Tax=Ohtaekwangia sp. TaxID=2066019 RepID=UPI002F9203D1
MKEIDIPPQLISWTTDQTLLWNKIKSFEIDDPQASLAFSDRLARENGWTLDFALRAIDEYKKFIFLICVSNLPLTPSDQVDQVWHLHLLYTYSYWKELCGSVLQREIHHGPTKGGNQEKSKFNDWYTRTLELYQQYFGYSAPADLWPSNQKRFKPEKFQRVNRDIYWLIKKPFK